MYKLGSTEEAIAIYMIDRIRSAKLTEALFSVVAPDKAQQLFRKYKSILFPEHKYDELEYIRKSKKLFDKLRNIDVWVKRPGKLRRG